MFPPQFDPVTVESSKRVSLVTEDGGSQRTQHRHRPSKLGPRPQRRVHPLSAASILSAPRPSSQRRVHPLSAVSILSAPRPSSQRRAVFSPLLG
ncbi:hypothetical protein EYF80_037976 [Liparis tanakae]|uniref:Uncharacterized protein n=1 Tax=Liparis tanakae TaxID=230148 RepID=A0A4Z2GE42_9TELE|nr:hypothetical protein EYF80_037976 [Liparis tanakae]